MTERMANRGFRVLPSYYGAIRDLPDEERLRMYDALFDFGCAGAEPENLAPLERAVFLLLRPTVESSARYFDEQTKRASLPRGGKRAERDGHGETAEAAEDGSRGAAGAAENAEPARDGRETDGRPAIGGAQQEAGRKDAETAREDGPACARMEAKDGRGDADALPWESAGERAGADGRGKKAGAGRANPGDAREGDAAGEGENGSDERESPAGREKKPRAPRFTPPTAEEVESFARETGLRVDAARFCDYYASNGWMIGGKAKMRDWRAAARNWARKEGERDGSLRGRADRGGEAPWQRDDYEC